ncbi:hypothetical protein H0H93_015926 [Arthromyces matolae]|nr:hypothetical protein H0H93_015926 [Arthromyces matolae]
MSVTRIALFLGFSLLSYQGLQYTTGDKLQDYSMGSTIGGQFFTALHLLLLVDPIKQYRHVRDTDDPRTRPLLKRVYWTGCIIHSPRGIGWNYQVGLIKLVTPHVPPRPRSTRWYFIASRILRALACFLVIDAAQTFIHTNSLFLHAHDTKVSITSQSLLFRCLNIIAWISTPLAGVRMQYYMISAVNVSLGLSVPGDWPDPYGNWSDAYTVRNLWGRTWHQMMRRYISSVGKAVTQVAGFKKGTLLSAYTQLLVGFIVSGVMHSFGDAMVGWQYLGASFPFFVMQPFAIIAEDIIIGLARRFDCQLPPKVCYALGYTWVLAWSMFSFPFYIDWAVKAGLGSSELLPISPIRMVLQGLRK